jgi:hypothetical protein
MSRSYKKHNFCGHGNGGEKKDKRLANRSLRRCVKIIIHTDPETERPFPVMREISDIWNMDKDGKTYFGDLLSSRSRMFPHKERSNDPYWIKEYRKLKGK